MSDPAGPALLRIRGLGHAFVPARRAGKPTPAALSEFDLELRRGEIVGLLGPNGSGKSTALALIAGLLPLRTGTLAFEGRPLSAVDRSFRAALGVVFQQPSVDKKLSARENLELALGMHGVSGSAATARARELLDQAGLLDRADEPLKNLSGGMRRRVDLVRAVAHGPRLLLLDEPSAGLDEQSFRRLWDQLERLRARSGMTILVATHRPDEAERCDRLVVLDAGRQVAHATPRELIAAVAADVVRVRACEAAELAREVAERFAVAVELDGDELVIGHPRGHELIVRIVESFPRGRIDAITVQRPTLAEVFLHLTGHSLDHSTGPGSEVAA